jgi:FHS family L-fucose permease-like MFS transporter
LSDIIGIHQSYIITVVCFVYLALFAILVKKILKKQGINVDEIEVEASH